MTIKELKNIFLNCLMTVVIVSLLLYPGVYVAKRFVASIYNDIDSRTFVLAIYANPSVFIRLAKYDYARGRYDLFLNDIQLGLSLCSGANQPESCLYLQKMLSNYKLGININE